MSLSPWDEVEVPGEPGDLVLVAGRPNSGMSWVCCRLAADAIKHGMKVLYYAAEMQERDVRARIGCIIANVPYRDWRMGNCGDTAASLAISEASTELLSVGSKLPLRLGQGDVVILDMPPCPKRRFKELEDGIRDYKQRAVDGGVLIYHTLQLSRPIPLPSQSGEVEYLAQQVDCVIQLEREPCSSSRHLHRVVHVTGQEPFYVSTKRNFAYFARRAR